MAVLDTVRPTRSYLALLVLTRLVAAQNMYPVKWSTKTYGPDGPWYAVSASVGGYDDGTEAGAYQTAVDLLPGGTWFNTIISPHNCNATGATPNCGEGGTWDPQTAFGGILSSQTLEKTTIGYQLTDNNFAGDMRYLSGSVYAQRLVLNGRTSNNFPTLPVPNSTIAVTENATVVWPNGRRTSLNIGNLALGASDPRMNFAHSNQDNDWYVTWNVPGYLDWFNKGSDSYTIQLGSTALKYPPSLVFGGYDQGRGIGNIVSWSSTALTLDDIVLGVETGGSPWDFTSKTGLLLNNVSKAEPLPVFADPISPYLHLPETTCRNLAQYLPIYYDSISKYYLWNTSDPSYTKVVTSAAYLGFVFPPSFGSLDPVTIKVPMIYLNLTLEPVASGLQNSVAYFPCQNYYPSFAPLGTAGEAGGTYTLGRAFLQAAILGRNWKKGIAWLAQAPGPGANNAGLGYNPKILSAGDTTLTFPNDTSLFNATMKGYWTPLPGPSVPSPSSNASAPNAAPSSSTEAVQQSQGLSTSAKIGIGVGIGVAVVLSLLLGALLCLRRRKASQLAAHDGYNNAQVPRYGVNHYDSYGNMVEIDSARPDGYYKQFEYPQELSGTRPAREIDSRNVMGRRYELAASH